MVLEDSEFLASTRSRHSTIRSAALPSHFGGIAALFHCPAINRARAGWLFWFIWFIWFIWSTWFVWFVSFVWLNETN